MKISGFWLFICGQTLYKPVMFRPRSLGLLLALVTLVIYLPATSYHFINFDDPDYVSNNNVVQSGLTWWGIKWAFTGSHASNWHPLTWMSHMLDCNLFQLNPAGPHLVNILFHSANAALLFLLVFRLTKKLWPAAFIAALFAWHPLHVESVAWVSERKDVLSTFFTLLTLLAYARFASGREAAQGSRLAAEKASGSIPQPASTGTSYTLALIFFTLALLAKPMPVTLPLVMLLLDYWPLRRVTADTWSVAKIFRLVLEKWPFFALAAASCVVTCLAQHNALNPLANVPVSLRLENALTTYGAYLWKMIWPTQLAAYYQLRAPIARAPMAESAVLLIGVSVLAWRERKSGPWLAVGWLWYLITLLPVIGLVQVGGQAMADRYTYFPLIGIFIALTFSFSALAEAFVFLKKWLAAVAVIILVACVCLTEKQMSYWHDSETLFSHSIEVTPSEPAYLCVGNTLTDQGKTQEALTELIMAWRLNPDSAMANGTIAYLLNAQGKTAAAAKYYDKSVHAAAPVPSIFKNYGIVLVLLGHYDQAMDQFLAAAKLDPSSADPHVLMASLLLQTGRDAEAMTQLRLVLQLDPLDLQTAIFTANLLAADESPQGRNGAEALALAQKIVSQTGSQQPVALDALAMANAELGRFDEAVRLEQNAIQLAGTNSAADDLIVMQKRLAAYQKNQPWRESFKRAMPTPQKLSPN